MAPSNLERIVRQYYADIDAVRLKEVLRIFSNDAVYHRADAVYEGMGSIREFFTTRRLIRGQHVLDTVACLGNAPRVLATGRFEGVGANGGAKSIGYADVWQFNSNDQVELRVTYLMIGHEYVEK